MPQFMLIIRDGDKSKLPAPDSQEMQDVFAKFGAWRESLAADNRFMGGEKLTDDGGHTVRRRNGKFTVEGPYAEAHESVGGYFTVRADSYEEACELAQACPTFDIGGFIEVRRLQFAD